MCIYLSEAKWHLNVLKPLILTQALWHEEEKRERGKKEAEIKQFFFPVVFVLK